MAESLHDNIANKSNCELTSRLGAKSIALKPAKKHKFYTLLQILVVQSPDFTVFRKNLTRNSRRALKKCLIGKKRGVEVILLLCCMALVGMCLLSSRKYMAFPLGLRMMSDSPMLELKLLAVSMLNLFLPLS
jgi:hypothetical protein